MADGGYFLTATKEKNSSGAGDGTANSPTDDPGAVLSHQASAPALVLCHEQ